MYTLIWTKIIVNAITFDPSGLGQVCHLEFKDLNSAENEARKILKNDHFNLIKIIENKSQKEEPLNIATEYFDICFRRMLQSVELLNKPICKRKKKVNYYQRKKLLLAAKKEQEKLDELEAQEKLKNLNTQ